ncbi:MAG: transglutaminase family protein [Myxococcales bacterium]|nr:transglutaminase family protein [Myxococcales bacterium]
MAIRVGITHQTQYHYDRPINLGPQIVRLRPAPHYRNPIVGYSLTVRPSEHFVNWQQDPNGNYLARYVFPAKTRELSLTVDLVADLEVINPFDFFLEPESERFPFAYPEGLAKQLSPYLERGSWGPRFAAYLASVDQSEKHIVQFLVDFNQKVQREIEYVLRFEHGLQSPEETLERGRGACRDFAWLQVQLLRHLGIAARFVSGYSVQLVADVKPLEGAAGVAKDVVDLHAWAEAFLPGAGWVGLDGTSGLMAGEGHIPLACAADPEMAAPISGALDECEVEFHHQMRVQRIDERPRTTKPYTDEQWEAIVRAGDRVDERLEQQDVRLTMGGEPTFVSVDDYRSAQWTVAAEGQHKRERAEALIRRLRERFAPRGLLQFVQGKWYPGESLPRWALYLLWRTDGDVLWEDERWIATPQTGDERPATIDDARRFTHALAERLGTDPEHVLEAFEDAIWYSWREGLLPVNVDPRDPELEDAEERDRLRRVFQRGLTNPVGCVLPLRLASSGERRWESGLWMLRARPLVLTPGDSPLGLRLPLPSLPYEGDSAIHHVEISDPMQPRPPLPPRAALGVSLRPAERHASVRRQSRYDGEGAANRRDGAEESAFRGPVVRTALCVEPRDGRLCIFLPPLPNLEAFVELIATIESVARELELPIVLEGYPAPPDPRLETLKVTPDPGVIEVNVQPASSWRELVLNTTILYEEARLARLGTVRFLVDGQEVGTGGGNHFVLGAREPLSSPFLRRPELLAGMVTYWNNHPSLSYLFSSLFIGPTSQAPRLDEARHDSLYELEIALEQLRGISGPVPPWLVDRLFRNLLIDATGNTHRAEFCIDKLYAPETVTGRLGLLELRSFEMPPHSRMGLAQALLVRAVVGWLFEHPYRNPLLRWGSQLHDRFMLSTFVRMDFDSVIDDLRNHGFPLEASWFEPHHAFRFPHVGTATYDGVTLSLFRALEPWNVLGEEPAAGGTVRYVDSSVERLEVRLRGAIDGRHALLCNGYRIPLAPTDTLGELVGGVRYRAWQPPHCLHPNIGVHTPLVFDLVDTFHAKSLGGCRYHVGHPGGRNYDEPPVNALEAEGRRLARFEPLGHTAGAIQIVEPIAHPEFPLTLDLRRQR